MIDATRWAEWSAVISAGSDEVWAGEEPRRAMMSICSAYMYLGSLLHVQSPEMIERLEARIVDCLTRAGVAKVRP